MTTTHNSNSGDNPKRLANRIMVIGLDGATFYVLDPLLKAGYMPNLSELIKTGTRGVLYSTKPPITPAAWTTFMTGKGPGRHGVVDFERYNVHTGQLSFNSTFEIREKTIWDILSERQFKVGSIHLPMTYPPPPINGFVVSGFETPSVEAEFTHPPELKQQILEEMPAYSYTTNWKRKIFGGKQLLKENLEYISRSFDQAVELTELCSRRHSWDVMMVLLKLVDNLQHKCWAYLDPRTADRWPEEAEMSRNCLKRLDKALGELIRIAKERDATILVMSDHGHGSLDGKAQPNLLLNRWGYLTFRPIHERVRTRLEHIWYRMTKKKGPRFAQGSIGVERDLAIDWSQSQACVIHAGIYGFLYLNVKGRQPQGIVETEQFETLRSELQKKLLDARDDSTGEPIFTEVHKTEELYGCQLDEIEGLPDLLLVPAAGLAVVRKIRGRQSVRWERQAKLGGTHRIDGILVANGPHIHTGGQIEAQIADIAPTLLAMVGVPVPIDMEGQALRNLFDVPLQVEFEPPQKRRSADSDDDVFSEKEKELLTERLSDLGYLE